MLDFLNSEHHSLKEAKLVAKENRDIRQMSPWWQVVRTSISTSKHYGITNWSQWKDENFLVLPRRIKGFLAFGFESRISEKMRTLSCVCILALALQALARSFDCWGMQPSHNILDIWSLLGFQVAIGDIKILSLSSNSMMIKTEHMVVKT